MGIENLSGPSNILVVRKHLRGLLGD